MKKLFVGNLSFDATEDSLRTLFSEAGTVETVTIIIDKMSNRSKGFGFVEMSTEEEAQKAIAELNGKEVDGRALTVNEARPMEERPRRDDRGGSGSGGGFGGGRGRW